LLEDIPITIEHKLIPDDELHPVKGAASATLGQVLVANGAGDASFVTLAKTCGSMVLVSNTGAVTVAAAGDATLATNADYVLVDSAWAGNALTNVGFATDHLIALRAGTYRYTISASILPASTSKTALKLSLSGIHLPNKVVASTPATEYTSMSITGLVTLPINATISVFVANTVGDVTVSDAVVTIDRVDTL